MVTFFDLTKKTIKELEYEVISEEARLKLTRLIRKIAMCEDDKIHLIRMNRLINIANSALGRPIYRLETDDMGEYMPEEFVWHTGELELIFRRPNTIKLLEILGDMIEENLLKAYHINAILKEDVSSVEFILNDDNDVSIRVYNLDEVDDEVDLEEHPNIRILIGRMEKCFEEGDFAGVLHSSASVFETLAKDIVTIESVQNSTLGSFFERYKKDSGLPEPILDYILEIYKRRNSEPLAGHGSTGTPSITKEEAILLKEMTKTFVRMERNFNNLEIKL